MRSRRLEQQTTYGDSGLVSEWETFTGEGAEVPDTYGWDAADYSRFVRAWNAAAKKRGDYTRLRSVENEDAFS